MNVIVEDQTENIGLIAVSESTPPITSPADAEVDIAILKSVPRQFEINSEQTANWLVRRINEARDYGERVKLWSAQEQRRAGREEQTLMFLFGRQIENWTRSEIQRLKGKRRSIALPSGTIGVRTLISSLVIDDEVRVMEWARVNVPAAVIVAERLSRAEIAAHYKDTGEIPTVGASEPEKERFFIR